MTSTNNGQVVGTDTVPENFVEIMKLLLGHPLPVLHLPRRPPLWGMYIPPTTYRPPFAPVPPVPPPHLPTVRLDNPSVLPHSPHVSTIYDAMRVLVPLSQRWFCFPKPNRSHSLSRHRRFCWRQTRLYAPPPGEKSLVCPRAAVRAQAGATWECPSALAAG